MKITLKQKAYNYILDKIVSGDLKAGVQISEVAMAKEIGISPTPLREAYRQLATEGVVVHIPNSGIFVRELNEVEIAELYEMREALETFAARKATQEMNLIQINDLKKICDVQTSITKKLSTSKIDSLSPIQEAKFMKADTSFHLYILNATKNSVIIKSMQECHIMSHLLTLNSHEHTLKQVKTTIDHHLKILNSIKNHNGDSAEKWMRKHIQFSAKTALKNRRSMPEAMGSIC